MQSTESMRAALAGTRRDPQVIDRLVGTIGKSPTTLLQRAATVAAQTKTRPQIAVCRFQSRRLIIGRWPYQRTIIVVTVRTLILREVAQ
jgi:hypothetical protein